ncbi:hypothetical protein ACT91Q_21465 [Brevibacillus thermoruber]|jgi:putative NADPH-quinone reductase|uniref:hypothetical protein n=1 Tax=Brevibacillus thermoruber TaxID=33942 RepID=UPI004042B6AE
MAAIVLRFYLAVAVLAAEGHQVKVSDLYAMNFKAVTDDETSPIENGVQAAYPVKDWLTRV